jgi:hypothetical protein
MAQMAAAKESKGVFPEFRIMAPGAGARAPPSGKIKWQASSAGSLTQADQCKGSWVLRNFARRCSEILNRTNSRAGLNLEPDQILNRTPATARATECSQSRADRFGAVYLRDAQAYMLISMPTDTSTIFGVFQVIRGPPN